MAGRPVGSIEGGRESEDTAVIATLSMEIERLIINNGHNFGSVINILDTQVTPRYGCQDFPPVPWK